MKKLGKFYVTAAISLDVGINIEAENIDDALMRAKRLKQKEFVEFLGDFFNGGIRITGVMEG